MTDPSVADVRALLDWRRRVAELYSTIRSTTDARAAWQRWTHVRRELFREHPQSPVPPGQRHHYTGPYVYDYDPGWRALAIVESAPARNFELPTSDGGVMSFTRFGRALLRRGELELSLEMYWLTGYGGGVFVPFADATSGGETYGAGRYVLDTIKGADLGEHNGRLVVDFNFSYQPSCSYDPSWSCPLALPANRLTVPVRAGERLAPH